MAEAPEPAASGAPRVFISYSRADRQRVTGLFELLQALDHQVFMDERSIRAGRRWRPELEKELHAADVLVVFWTRHARDSKWVRREYVDFNTRFPDRPIVPIRGDKSELTHRLAVHQHTDFCPIINELLDMVRDLEDKKISKKEIRAAVIRRLEEEGIELTEENRKLYLGLFGGLGLGSAPLFFVETARDFFADKLIGLPTAYLYTAGVAAVAGFLGCHTLFGGGGDALNPDTHPIPIKVGQSGSQACADEDMICVSVRRAPIVDINGKFFGYSTPTCNSPVQGESSSCDRDYGTTYAMTGVVVVQSPDADEGVEDHSGATHFCLSDKKGKKGIYEFANCVKP